MRPLAGSVLAVLFGLTFSACAGGNASGLPPASPSLSQLRQPSPSGKYIKHVVIMIQENRTFDNLFASFPGADGTTSGIIRFVENNWELGRLQNSTDRRAQSIGDLFDFNRRPRKFRPIAAKYSRSFFEHQPPSGKPVDIN